MRARASLAHAQMQRSAFNQDSATNSLATYQPNIAEVSTSMILPWDEQLSCLTCFKRNFIPMIASFVMAACLAISRTNTLVSISACHMFLKCNCPSMPGPRPAAGIGYLVASSAARTLLVWQLLLHLLLLRTRQWVLVLPFDNLVLNRQCFGGRCHPVEESRDRNVSG